MHGHLTKRAVENLVSENTRGYTNIALDVEVSTGSVFKTMKLNAHVFRPQNWLLLRQSRFTSGEVEEHKLVRRYSPPIGLMALDVTHVKKKCERHVEEMVQNQAYANQTTAGDITQLPHEILEIVQRYCSMKEVS